MKRFELVEMLEEDYGLYSVNDDLLHMIMIDFQNLVTESLVECIKCGEHSVDKHFINVTNKEYQPDWIVDKEEEIDEIVELDIFSKNIVLLGDNDECLGAFRKYYIQFAKETGQVKDPEEKEFVDTITVMFKNYCEGFSTRREF